MKTAQSGTGRLLPVLMVMVITLLAADMVLRVAPGFTRSHHGILGALATSTVAAETLSTASAAGTTSDSAVTGRKADVRRRLLESAAATYLPSMLPQVDSAIRRWPDDRFRRPLRIAVVRGRVPGFHEEFAGAVAWAVNRWNVLGLPVQFDFRGADTTGADITVAWVPMLDSGRTGKADITWDQRQYIRRAAVSLATHAPDGRLLNNGEMTALALHELGHALGLAHSTDPHDALYPMTRAGELSARDEATVKLLYELPIGSLRN